MPSILIIEDGTGLANANAYVSADGVRAYATLRGVTLPVAASPDPVEILIIKATDYLESLAYIMYRAVITQALSWPRVRCKHEVDPTKFLMPTKVVSAQCQLVLEQFMNDIVLLPSTPGGAAGQFVIREKVDVIETQYSERLGTLSTPTMPAVDALLRELIVPGGGIGRIGAVRV
jgi:hypothetical protein